MKAFLQQLNGPVSTLESVFDDETGELLDRRASHPSIMATIYATTPPVREPLYVNGVRNPLKRYIGRAGHISAGINPNESLWCIKADIKAACLRLRPRQRLILGLTYIRDWSHDTIATYLDLHPSRIEALEAAAITDLAAYLDRLR